MIIEATTVNDKVMVLVRLTLDEAKGAHVGLGGDGTRELCIPVKDTLGAFLDTERDRPSRVGQDRGAMTTYTVVYDRPLSPRQIARESIDLDAAIAYIESADPHDMDMTIYDDDTGDTVLYGELIDRQIDLVDASIL